MLNGRFFAGLLVCFMVFFAGQVAANAETIYVDINNVSGTEDGTSEYPFNTIQEGINAATYEDAVEVAPGTYNEGLSINSINIKLIGEDPRTTIIQGSSSVIVIQGVFNSGYNVVEVSGFTITGGADQGIYLNSSSVKVRIYNNIILGNTIGINAKDSEATIYNNAIRNNSEYGIYGRYDDTELAICSNIIIENGIYGIRNGGDSAVISCFYNNVWANVSANYYYTINKVGEISADPLFVDAGTGNYQLSYTSPCIDAGQPLAAYNDPDGTRNDMGVYGGPGAAGFWPEPAGGPVVTDLSVTPPSVPVGGTLTLKATGKIR